MAVAEHAGEVDIEITMAAMLINNGADIRAVQEVLGHASILSTQVYTKLPISQRTRRSNVDVNPRERIAVQASDVRIPIRRR